MTWATIEQIGKIIGWVVGLGGVIFLSGRLFQRALRGELGDVKLSPMQQIAVDLAALSRTFTREIAELRAQIGTQYTDVAAKVNMHHTDIKRLSDALNNEYARLCGEQGFLYSRQMIDRLRAESENDRNKLREDILAIKAQCFDTHAGRRSTDKAGL